MLLEPIGKSLANYPQSTNAPPVKPRLQSGETRDLRRELGVASLGNTFANFRREKGTRPAFEVVRGLSVFNCEYSLVLVYGGVGNGKSYLCDALALEWYSLGVFCRVTLWKDLVDCLRRLEFHREDGEPYPDTVVAKLGLASQLIVDDYGLGGSDWKLPVGWLEKIIDRRYHDQKPTLLTTNLPLDKLPDRVVSRFQDAVIGRCVLNEGKDFRPLKERLFGKQ